MERQRSWMEFLRCVAPSSAVRIRHAGPTTSSIGETAVSPATWWNSSPGSALRILHPSFSSLVMQIKAEWVNWCKTSSHSSFHLCWRVAVAHMFLFGAKTSGALGPWTTLYRNMLKYATGLLRVGLWSFIARLLKSHGWLKMQCDKLTF